MHSLRPASLLYAGIIALAALPFERATAQTADERLKTDWPYLQRYRAENAALSPPKAGEHRVVFMGNSITEG